ncbi:MAG TPA: hypothetical protein VN823_11050 [Stellaceae bacterium]|nr:hypothetical protein [Stellaceae bacterium]
MDQRELARLLIKVAGLLIAVYALIDLPYQIASVFGLFHQNTGRDLWEIIKIPTFWGMTISPAAISFGLGLSLFFGGGRIVNRYLVAGSSDVDARAGQLQGLEEVAVAVLGIYLLTGGLIDAARLIAQLLYNAATLKNSFSEILAMSRSLDWMISTAVRVAIGVALMLRGHALVALRRGLVGLRPMADRQ